MTPYKIAAVAAAALLSAVSAAEAQSAPIAGVCVLDQRGVLATSMVGKSVSDRLKQLATQVGAELQTEGTALQADVKTFEAQRSGLSTVVASQREAALEARNQALQQKADLRQREMQATQQKALERISVEAGPIVQSVAAQHDCSLLLSQSALLLPVPSLDVTAAVVRGLDAKIQQFPFDREHLDQAQ
jgi:outer membrane protein